MDFYIGMHWIFGINIIWEFRNKWIFGYLDICVDSVLDINIRVLDRQSYYLANICVYIYLKYHKKLK